MRLHAHIIAARPRRARPGFTLIEASLTTVIIGVGFMAVLQLLAAGTAANVQAAARTTGMNLGKNLRELSLKMPYADLKSLDATTYSPPIDSRGLELGDFATWSQTLTVQEVDPNRLTLDIADASPKALRITVAVSHNGAAVCNVSWFAFDGTP